MSKGEKYCKTKLYEMANIISVIGWRAAPVFGRYRMENHHFVFARPLNRSIVFEIIEILYAKSAGIHFLKYANL